MEKADIALIHFNAEDIIEIPDIKVEDCARYLKPGHGTWVHVHGDVDPPLLERFQKVFKLHTLALEDILNAGHRPKAEIYDDQVFVILSMPFLSGSTVEIEQVSFFLGENYLLSFFHGKNHPFEPVRQRLHASFARMRNRKVDYLFYSLVDLVIDSGFPVMEDLGLQIESLEQRVLEKPEREVLNQMHSMKRELLTLRRMMWPHRDVINRLLRDDDINIDEHTRVFLRDCYDHIIQILELIETYRESMVSIQDLYLSSVSNRMTEVMRILTVIATIFIPLTFIVGVYGMNFNTEVSPWNMPELKWYYGYPALLSVIVAVFVCMVVYFRRKKWF